MQSGEGSGSGSSWGMAGGGVAVGDGEATGEAAGDALVPPWTTVWEGPRFSVARVQPGTRAAGRTRTIGPGRVARPRVTRSFITSNRRGRHCQGGTVLNSSA